MRIRKKLEHAVEHVVNDAKEIGHNITHHHHNTNEVPVDEPKDVSVSTSTASLFDKVKKLEAHFNKRPTGKFYAAADHLRRKFAKATEDHHFPKELAAEYPAFDKLVRELLLTIDKEEENREAFLHQELQDRFTFLQKEVASKQAEHKTRLQEYEDKVAEITGRKKEIAELKELTEIPETSKKTFCPTSIWKSIKSKFQKHAEVATNDAKVLEQEANKNKPKRSSFHMNLDVNVDVDLAKVIHGNVKKFYSSNESTSKEGARGILQYHADKIAKEEANLEKPADLDIEEMDQLSKVEKKISDEENKHPFKLSPETMLALIRTYESCVQLIFKAVTLEKVKSHHSTDHLLKSLQHGVEKMLKDGGKFYCPAINDLQFNHFTNAFTVLPEVEKEAIIRGNASDEVLNKFMPQQPVYDQVAGVRIK